MNNRYTIIYYYIYTIYIKVLHKTKEHLEMDQIVKYCYLELKISNQFLEKPGSRNGVLFIT